MDIYDILPSLLDPSVKLGNYSVTTNNGQLTVTIPETRIETASFVGGQFHLSVTSALGANYTLEFKDSLADPKWATAQTQPGTGGTVNLTDSAATNSARFYRIQVQ